MCARVYFFGFYSRIQLSPASRGSVAASTESGQAVVPGVVVFWKTHRRVIPIVSRSTLVTWVALDTSFEGLADDNDVDTHTALLWHVRQATCSLPVVHLYGWFSARILCRSFCKLLLACLYVGVGAVGFIRYGRVLESGGLNYIVNGLTMRAVPFVQERALFTTKRVGGCAYISQIPVTGVNTLNSWWFICVSLVALYYNRFHTSPGQFTDRNHEVLHLLYTKKS